MGLEKDLRDEAIFKMVALPVDDPNYSQKCAFHKGFVTAIQEIWRKRDLIRKSKPPKKGGAHAHHEEPEEDEDDFDLEDY